MIPAAISKRYARALVDLAQQAGRLEAVASSLKALSDTVEQHAELRTLVRHPGFSVEQRSAVFNDIQKGLGSDELLRPFIGLVIEKDRLLALGAISDAVQELADAALGRVRAQATSAQPLTAAQEAAVQAALQRRVGCTVLLETSVDPSLIAGVQVQLGSERLDGTVRGRLDRLGRQLLA